MAGRESWLKVGLRAGSFTATLRQMKGMSAGAGKTMGVLLGKPIAQGFRAGVKEARASLGELKKEFNNLADKAKDKLAFAATLGGAVSVGALVKSAMEGQAAYIDLGISLTKVEGKAVSAAQAQMMVENAARRTKIQVDELIGVTDELKDVGVDKFEDTLVRSQMQAKRLGLDGMAVANIYKTLLTKGLADSAAQAEILMERIANIDDDKLNPDIIREFSVQMGVAGGKTENMLNVIEAVGGQVKDFKAASEVVKQFGQSFGSAKGMDDLTKSAGVGKVKLDANASAFENFANVVATGTSKSQAIVKAFWKSFGNEKSQKMLETLMGKELMIKIQEGKASRLELVEASERLKTLYNKQFDVESEKARIMDADAQRLQSAQARYNDAMNKLNAAFRSPKVIGAIEKLADKLPALADGIARLIEVVVDHPGESLAAVVLGRVSLGMASAFGSAAIQKAGEAGMKALMARLLVVNAATAGGQGLLGAAGIGAGAAGVGAKTAGAAAATMAGGVLAAGAAGAAVGYGIYKVGMEKGQHSEFDAARQASQAVTDAGMAKNPEQIRAALARLAEARQGMSENKSGTNTVFGGLASMVTGVESAGELRARKEAEIKAAEDRLNDQLDSFRASAAKATKALDAVGGASTSRGPLRAADPQPGARPVGG